MERAGYEGAYEVYTAPPLTLQSPPTHVLEGSNVLLVNKTSTNFVELSPTESKVTAPPSKAAILLTKSHDLKLPVEPSSSSFVFLP